MTMGGPYNRSDTLAVFMYSESFRKFKMGYGSSAAVVLLGPAVVVGRAYVHPVRLDALLGFACRLVVVAAGAK